MGCGRFGNLSLSQRKVSPNVMVYSCLFHNLSGLEISTIQQSWATLEAICMPILGSHLFRLRMAMELPLIQMRRAARTWSVETTRKVTVYPWVTMCLPPFFFRSTRGTHTNIHIHIHVDVNIDICRYTMMHTCLESQSC